MAFVQLKLALDVILSTVAMVMGGSFRNIIDAADVSTAESFNSHCGTRRQIFLEWLTSQMVCKNFL